MNTLKNITHSLWKKDKPLVKSLIQIIETLENITSPSEIETKTQTTIPKLESIKIRVHQIIIKISEQNNTDASLRVIATRNLIAELNNLSSIATELNNLRQNAKKQHYESYKKTKHDIINLHRNNHAALIKIITALGDIQITELKRYFEEQWPSDSDLVEFFSKRLSDLKGKIQDSYLDKKNKGAHRQINLIENYLIFSLI